MTLRQSFQQILNHEDLNFLLTNRIPRQTLTRLLGRFSKIEQPLIRDLSISIWKFFSDLDLSEAKKQHFSSMHDCFTRELKNGSRTVDQSEEVITSPSDGIVGACGNIRDLEVLQVKGFPYTLIDLLGDEKTAGLYRNGLYVTIRLTSSMYHRFHAPHNCVIEQVNYISGDTWNVNPIALKRVEKLFCKNERAVLKTRLTASGATLLMVPVAAILVASIRLHFLNVLLHLKYRGPNVIPCNASFKKGDELGWFQHGSTILIFAPQGFTLHEGIVQGCRLRMGQALMNFPEATELRKS
jgi:phosphatidylserine decarboxylase